MYGTGKASIIVDSFSALEIMFPGSPENQGKPHVERPAVDISTGNADRPIDGSTITRHLRLPYLETKGPIFCRRAGRSIA
jgi:hypothetical protein